MAAPFTFARPARTQRNAVIVLGVVFVLLMLRVLLDAAWGFLILGALLVLPAVWDMALNRVATLELDASTLRWNAAGQRGTVPLDEIKKVILDTRLDLSVRMSVDTTDGARFRLPSECVPQKDVIGAACEAQGLRVERNAFALL
ncbi:hypothetical protein [Pseudaestuariivita sp.]|uniref:hypothetical protein n=1 Tax=Pseudaestuariivita sp. TaxID=2211669 RepID=UPI004059DA75